MVFKVGNAILTLSKLETQFLLQFSMGWNMASSLKANKLRDVRIISILKIKTKTHLLLLYFIKVVPKKKKKSKCSHQSNKREKYG